METPVTGKEDLKLNADTVRKILVDFVRDETSNAGFSKAIIGLSGGVDSSLVTSLSVEALGKNNVIAVMMPYTTSSPDSAADAKLVIDQLGIRSESVDISPMVDGYLLHNGEMNNVRRGNVMARARMIVLYDL